jgi:hypothetical protein
MLRTLVQRRFTTKWQVVEKNFKHKTCSSWRHNPPHKIIYFSIYKTKYVIEGQSGTEGKVKKNFISSSDMLPYNTTFAMRNAF